MPSKRITKVGLVQIGDKFGEQYYLPYSVGLLQSCAQKNLKNPKDFIFLLPVYKRLKIAKAVEYLAKADVVFFSAYIWNYQVNLAIAKKIKKSKKNCLIVFGGPQVPESAEALKSFLKSHTFVDIASYGEGELAFLNILDNFQSKAWENAPSIGFFNKENKFVYNLPSDKKENLKPASPYLDGIFDRLMEANPGDSWSGLIETNRGCPFSCAYCYWGRKAQKRVCLYDIERIYKEIDWFSRKKIEFIFCCDANFGLFDRDFEIVRKVAENKRKYGYPMAFSVQNTKNSTEKIFKLQKELNDAGLQRGVNLALQSLNEKTLKSISRNNISNETYKELQLMFSQNRIPTFSDLILGLPNESYASFTEGVSKVIEEGQHNRLQFINLMVLENTAMADPAYQKKYGLVIKESKVILPRTNLDSRPEIFEKQQLVIGTKSMPKNDWVKTRIFCWTTSLLHFNKLLQIPFIILNKLGGADYRDLIEIFTGKTGKYPEISKIISAFVAKAKDIQKGNGEYVPSKRWLNIWWPIDEYIFIKLFREGKINKFYREAESALGDFLGTNKIKLPPELLADAIKFNRALIRLPFLKNDLEIVLNYNIPEIYQGVLNGQTVALARGPFKYRIDRIGKKLNSWKDWYREVVWYGTKRGAYFYNWEKV
ncbi:MAG: B12-binding domain-containing radical SAM protein [Candidatus Moranbacteria bacterium]|nr:B12-binding domain-containing radical SAM protein [Candidatus Moranbacteria bacterium]